MIPFQPVWSALVVVSAPRASNRCDTATWRGPNSTLGPTILSLMTIYEPSRTSLLRIFRVFLTLNRGSPPILTFFST